MHLLSPMAYFHLYLLIMVLIFSSSGGARAATFELQNRCTHTIWPGIQPGAGHQILMNGGLELRPNQKSNITAPNGWSGRIWARAGCTFDNSGRKGSCLSGDCGGGLLECAGTGGTPPATLAEFTLNSPLDFYDVSLVDGYNMPISITPSNNVGSDERCKSVRCVSDLNSICPVAMQVVKEKTVVACKSACMAFDNEPEYCCTGRYNDPNICKPNRFSRLFKASCPDAYSYAYDDATSTFTCQNADYLITFC